MKIYTTWQKPAHEPAFVMPIHASASAHARTLTCGIAAVVARGGTDAVRTDAVRVNGVFPGSPAWSPPIS